MREIVVVHSSDIHVDDGYTAQQHQGDGAAGLAAVLGAARTLMADVVLLAGDTFESHRLPQELLDRTAALIAASEVPIVLLPGNHDPAIDEAVYRRGALATVPNLHILGVTDGESVVFDGLDLVVWGRPHRAYADMAPLRDPPARKGQRYVIMAHGHYEPAPDYGTRPRPGWLISDAELAAADADYIALGHWNRFASVGTGAAAYYSGSPDYARSVNLVRLGTGGEVDVSRVPLGTAGLT
jgi:DNA repair exonuclease SbcCD nuclease subunit